MNTVPILDCEFGSVTLRDTVEWARDWIERGQSGYICTVNVAILMMMRSDPELKRFVDDAALVVADGQPLVWASHLQQEQLPERVTGCDLLDELCEMAAQEGFGVYFLGAHADVVAEAVRRLQDRNPGLRVSGVADGYFDEEEAHERARAIRESGAQLLFVGMGVPRQERFLQEHWEALGVPLAIPVGGSFEVCSGNVRRAPRILRRTGMEWAYRLAQEPRRLWKRYLITNTQFLVQLAKSVASSRSQSR